jgi:CheY-like chemotaxis protein/anti-sigma regulatory factor (Ser/Thr protein kinase)
MPKIKPHILIVDDNPFNRELISEVAHTMGFAVKEAKNGNEALLKIQEVDFNLITLDLLMPGMDGFETAEKIREMGISVPIIAVSALALKQDQQRSLNAGCNDFLPKPLENDKLRALLKKYKQKGTIEQNDLPRTNKSPVSISSDLYIDFHLILVEEDKKVRKNHAYLLSQAGFKVQEVANGSEALKLLDNPKNKVDLIVSNIFTSGIDGLGLLTIVKRNFAQVLVFLYTDSYDTSTFQFAIQQKVDGIIPMDQFESSSLEIIKSALSQSKLKDSRISEARTVAMVKKAQAQLIHSNCMNSCPGTDVAYKPLHTAGGDMLRCQKFHSDGQCGIILADVAGHDVTASYTSAIFTGILTSVWDNHQDPISLLKKINRELIKIGNQNSHVCATTIKWHRGTGDLQIASAGNPGGLMVHFDTGRPIYKSLPGGGMVLGILENDDLFKNYSETLPDNSYLFLFSDGIEIENLKNAIEDKITLFHKTGIKTICQKLIDKILETKEQEDDMILLCIHNTIESDKPDFTAKFLSTYNEVDNACVWLDQTLKDELIPENNDKDIIFLAAREAFLNAVEHGNEYRPTAYFRVDLFIRDQELNLNITDEGVGLDLKTHLRKPGDLTVSQIGKRGLSFMASVAHKIEAKGQTVTLIFKNSTNGKS